MKKSICILIICSFSISFISCTNKEEVYGFPPPIKHIQWGMTPNEVMKELKLTKDNILNDSGASITLSYDNTFVFGQKANIIMDFDMEYELGLLDMYVQFSNLNKDDLIKQLNKAYGKPVELDDQWVPYLWESKKIGDLPQKIQDRLEYLMIELPAEKRAKSDAPVGFSDDTVWRTTQNEALVRVSLNKDTLDYSAQRMAIYTFVKDNKKYNKLIDILF